MNLKRIFVGLSSLAFILSPLCVCAQENDFVAQSVDGNDLYADIDSAWQAAKNGVEIMMTDDWDLDYPLEIDQGETVTIEMNGHEMNRHFNGSQSVDGEVIFVAYGATLNLNGNNAPNTDFVFKGFDENKKTGMYTVTSGGLVTGGSSSNGGGIYMIKGSTVNLNHVAIAGNDTREDGYGGGIVAYGSDCFIDMKYSIVTNNRAYCGGGIGVLGENTYVNMEFSSISHNYATQNGGGVYSSRDATYVCMNKNSIISSNFAVWGGGGVYFDNPYCQVTSGDGLAEISDNFTTYNSGGGVVFGWAMRGNTALVKNITFSSNYAGNEGGAIDVYQKEVTIINCKFEDNSAAAGGAIYLAHKNSLVTNCTFTNNNADISNGAGGAIYCFGTNCTIDNCTITNNHADRAGGGIYVYDDADVILSGTVIIKNNKRGGDYADDLMLQKLGNAAAYIKGSVSNGSCVGIRTGDLGETQIGKDIPYDCSEYFFLNDDGNYHISFENKKFYKRSGSFVGSIFGDNNLGAAILVMTGICVVGVVILFAHNKKNREEA